MLDAGDPARGPELWHDVPLSRPHRPTSPAESALPECENRLHKLCLAGQCQWGASLVRNFDTRVRIHRLFTGKVPVGPRWNTPLPDKIKSKLKDKDFPSSNKQESVSGQKRTLEEDPEVDDEVKQRLQAMKKS